MNELKRGISNFTISHLVRLPSVSKKCGNETSTQSAFVIIVSPLAARPDTAIAMPMRNRLSCGPSRLEEELDAFGPDPKIIDASSPTVTIPPITAIGSIADVALTLPCRCD